MQQLHENVWYVLAILLAALLVGTLVRWLGWLRSRDEANVKNLGSMLVWWVLAAGLTAALVLGRAGAVAIWAMVSLLALREFIALTSARHEYRGAAVVAYAALPVQYGCIYFAASQAAWMLLPLALLLILAASIVVGGKTQGYLAAVAGLYWGVMLTVVCLSFAPMLLLLDDKSNQVAGVEGWFLYLLLLTQANDIAQALWGRAIGRRKITPTVSPNKTWEGFLLGMATTVVLAVLLGRLLTPLAAPWPLEVAGRSLAIPYLPAVAAGVLISVAGFVGDINMSALKRDLGVKDSGNLLPGQGGVLDRVDSLTFAAPVFFCYVNVIYG